MTATRASNWTVHGGLLFVSTRQRGLGGARGTSWRPARGPRRLRNGWRGGDHSLTDTPQLLGTASTS
jgi:hypothetical protein